MKKQIYFPGLNAVRFFAALMVLIDHLELFKSYFGIKTLWSEKKSIILGSSGVTVFFVLSGYLITYLLLIEKKESTIHIKNFYIRRILRIWPLYYLIVIIGFFIVPYIDFFKVPIYTEDINIQFLPLFFSFIFFMANIAFIYLPTVAFAIVLWSVAVEEQFYIFWPHVIKNSKNTARTLMIFLLIYLTVKLCFKVNVFHIKENIVDSINFFIHITRFSCMIIGGIAAFVVFTKKPKIIKIIFSTYTQFIAIICLIVAFSGIVNFHFYNFIRNEFIASMVAILLINISVNSNSVLKLENSVFNYLGKISYGIYLYHSFSVLICLKLFMLFQPTSTSLYYLWSALLLIAVIGITILISHVSYKYFERKILKFKIKYSTLVSGDLVHQNHNKNKIFE